MSHRTRDRNPHEPKALDSETILARLALEAEEAESEHELDDAEPHRMWSALDEETQSERPVPADRLRARFYRSLAVWEAEAARPPALERLERWLAGFWPQRPIVQLATAAATLLLGVALGLGLARSNGGLDAGDIDSQLGALRTELRTMNTRAALGLLDDSSAAERLRGVSLSSEALEDPRQEPDRLIDELLRIASVDESENVRLAAVEALARVADRAPVRRGLAATLPRQHSPVLQVAVADLLAERGGADGERALRELLDDPDLDPAVKARVYELVAASFGGTL